MLYNRASCGGTRAWCWSVTGVDGDDIMIKARVLIVEDDKSGRKLLHRLLDLCDGFSVVGEAGSVKDAAHLICIKHPDLLLLDVELTDGNSFELLDKLCDPPAVIFISGHQDYAADAFKVRALDYLVKPFSQARFFEALERFSSSRHSLLPTPFVPEKVLPLRQGAKIFFVPVADLVAIQASREYTTLWDLQGRSFVEKRPLCFWSQHLPPALFVQLDRALIVNLRCIDHVVQRSTLEMLLYMKSQGEPLVLGRSASMRLRACYPAL